MRSARVERTAPVAADDAVEAKRSPARMFSALRYPNYRYLWQGSLATSTGHWMQQVAMGWLALTLTDSAAWVGIVGFTRGIPMLLFSLVGGILADRMDRQRLLVSLQGVAGLLATLLTVAIVTDRLSIWLLVAFSFLTGTAMSIIFPTRQALMPNLVEREDLPNAVAINSATMNAARILGPSGAGFLLGALGPAGCFGAQAIGLIWALFMSARLRLPAALQARKSRQSPLHALREGFAYIRRDPMILALLNLAAAPTIFAMPYTQMLPVMARDELGAGPEGLGALLAAVGVGALGGSLMVAYLGDIPRKGAWLLGAAVASGLLLCLFSTARSLPVAMALLGIAGVAQAVYMALNSTLLQTLVPDEFRGRVMSVYMLTWGLMPLGTLPSGLIAEHFGAPLAIGVGGAISALVVVVVALRRPVLREMA